MATGLLVGILLVTVFAAQTASAAAPKLAKLTASGVRELPAGAGPARRGTTQSESLPPVVPGISAIPSGAGGTIFYDGFEGSVASWNAVGANAQTWAIFTYRPFAGQWSAYCAGNAGGSYNYPPGPYFNNMNAWLQAGPFDLSGVTAATFAFKLWLNSELNYDGIYYLVSLDGQNYYGPDGISGNTGGWTDRSLDLTAVPTLGNVCGRSQVWIAFNFTSDSSGNAEGAYVDEVSITGSGGGGEVGLFLEGDYSVVPFAGRVNLTGELRDTSGSLVPNQQVGLFWSQEDKIDGTWNLLNTYTSSTGQYSMTAINVQRLTYFAMVFAGDGRYSDGMSNLVKVMARAKLTPPAVPSRVRAGPKITSWGTLRPLHTAAQNRSSHTKVSVQRYSGGRWRPVVSLYAQSYRNTSSETRYSVGLRYVPGQWRMRAVHRDSDHATTTSSWRYFTAR